VLRRPDFAPPKAPASRHAPARARLIAELTELRQVHPFDRPGAAHRTSLLCPDVRGGAAFFGHDPTLSANIEGATPRQGLFTTCELPTP
jgi:hypothetical protein